MRIASSWGGFEAILAFLAILAILAILKSSGHLLVFSLPCVDGCGVFS